MLLSEHVYCVAFAFKMTEQIEWWICTKFWQKKFIWCGRLHLWVTGNWQLHHNNVPTHASHFVFWWNIKWPRWLGPLLAQVWCPVSSSFSKTKMTFEREQISNHWWDSRKYYGAADGNWEDYMRSQGAYSERDWVVIALCPVFLVSCIFFNKCLYFSYYMAGYLLDRPRILEKR